MIPFSNTYHHLPPQLFAAAQAARVPRPELIAWNTELAAQLGLALDPNRTEDAERIVSWFSGNASPAGAASIALAYAGHQFGHFVPQLGDGRALVLGEVRDVDGVLYDLQLKGSGPTAFSRRGDGKSPLGPVLREYLVSEAMHRLGVPTTRALAAVRTGETVVRHAAHPGGILTRVSRGHLRLGTCEFCVGQRDAEGLTAVLRYTAQRGYPDLDPQAPLADLALALFDRLSHAQADLVARWMSLGFIHGVMNTDNTSLLGETLDYGPCAFMDTFRLGQVYSSIDRQGRYAYGNQPEIAQWNLARFGDCLAWLATAVSGLPNDWTATLNSRLEGFRDLFEAAWTRHLGAKLALPDASPADAPLLAEWLRYLEAAEVDFTLAFRHLAQHLRGAPTPLPDTERWRGFVAQWRERLRATGHEPTAAADLMDAINPLYIPRNHQIEAVIAAAEVGDDGPFHRLAGVLAAPFDEHPQSDDLKQPPRPDQIVAQTFCGT